MDKASKCRLCKLEKKIYASHIIPHGLIRIVKEKLPQLIALGPESAGKPYFDNANWTEQLLCSACEKHLNLSYETTQIAVLKSKKIQHASRFTIPNFDYEKFYLFWISIFWRASESSLAIFDSVKLPAELSDLLRRALLDGSLSGNSGVLTDFVQVGVSRWTWDQADTRSVISSFKRYDTQESMHYIILVAGLAVVFQLSIRPSQPLPEGFSLVKKSFTFRMNILSPGQSSYLDNMLEAAQDAASRHPDFLGLNSRML